MELSIYSQEGTINLYFLLPINGKLDDISKILKYAFQACREHELCPSWLSTEDCLKMHPTKQDVFVCDPFEGEAFDYLLSGSFKSLRILGPQCLLTCLHSKKPVPELPSPLHNMAMHEIVATSTGYEKNEKTQLQQLVERMCGIYSNSFHEGITHLVSKSVGSKKYMVAVEKEIPIMTEEWVNAVWKASSSSGVGSVEGSGVVVATQEEFVKFTCPVFRGLVVCVSQLPRKEKDELRALIAQHGGTYAANLEMSVTSVLITPLAEGEKYKHATQWRIPCLSADWIHDSVESGVSMGFESYKVRSKPKASTPTNDLSVRGPPDVSLCSTIMNDESHMNGTVNVNETVDQQDLSLFLAGRRQPQHHQQQGQHHKITAGLSALEHLDLQSSSSSSVLFLDGCKVFPSGFEEEVLLREKLRRVLNAGGATRFNVLTEDSVTHVVVGKHVEDHLKKIRSWGVAPRVVTAEWLVECAKAGRPVDEEPFLYLKPEESEDRQPHHSLPAPPPPPPFPSLSPPTNNNNKRTTKGDQQEGKVDETLIDEELMNQYLVKGGGARIDNASVDCSTLPDSQESTCGGGLFKGHVFCVSGYSDEIEDHLVELVGVEGGEVVKARKGEGMSKGPTVDYCVVSVEGNGVFHPRARNYVTHLYLEDCIDQEVLLPVEYYHLPFVWPPSSSSPLSGCVIASSTYSGKERIFISHLATQMGALCQEVFCRRDNVKKCAKGSTHLVCPSAEGSKFGAALRWGVPALTKDWLFKTVDLGDRAPEGPFRVDEGSAPGDGLDCKRVLVSLLKRTGVLPNNCLLLSEWEEAGEGFPLPPPPSSPSRGVTPLHNRSVTSLRNQHSTDVAAIHTPDAETIRKLYPTPGCARAKNDDSLDAMTTPETPYGTTWYANPSARVRKGIKRALDALPEGGGPGAKRPFLSPGTPDDVYFRKYVDKVKDIVANHPKPPHLPPSTGRGRGASKEGPTGKGEGEEPLPQEEGPLAGVVVYASKKVSEAQKEEIEEAMSALGGEFRRVYDAASVTHFVHYGRLNDTQKEFRAARKDGKALVAPDWVCMCRDEGRRVPESLFPHVHNPKMSLSLVSTKSTPVRRGRRGEEEEGQEEEEEEEEGEGNRSRTKEALARQLEELETLASVTGGGMRKTPNGAAAAARKKSLGGGGALASPTFSRPSSTQLRGTNTETESQGTAITWDDPQEREARARLEVALVEDTQDDEQEQEQEQDSDEDQQITGNQTEALEDATSPPSSPSPPNYIFALSGMPEDERDVLVKAIASLGGSWIDSKHFDPSLTHIVTVKPSRSEKHLAAIACGKWIVHKSFIDESVRHGSFVDEEVHEWGNPLAVSLPQFAPESTEAKLSAAAQRWRIRVGESGVGAFAGMRPLFYSSDERVAAFTRLVEAGGGGVASSIEDDDVSHCFVEANMISKVDLAVLARRQVPCLLPVHLNELLIAFPPPNEVENCIQEYKDILANMTTEGRRLSRRSSKKRL